MTKFVGLRAKTYSYLIDDGSEDKKAKGTKKCVIKRKLKLENYKSCLEATQLDNKINYLEKNKIDIDSIKEFIKNNKSISKTQQIREAKSKGRGQWHYLAVKKIISIIKRNNIKVLSELSSFF